MTARIHLIPYLMILAISLALMATDLYLPAMPHMADFYGASDRAIQYTLTAFQFGLVSAALVYGPLSDSLGRRRMLLFGCGLYLISSVVLLFAPDVDFLIVMRALQGCGAGAFAALSPAIVRDSFSENESGKVIAQMSTFIILTPAIAPLIGGYLTVYFGWQSCFVFIAGCVALAFMAFLFLFPETLPTEGRTKLQAKQLIQNYKTVLSNKSFFYYVLAHSLPSCGVWCYITVMPFAYIKYMGVETEIFGYYAVAQVGILSVTSFFVQRIVAALGNSQTMIYGLYLFVIGSITTLMAALFAPTSPMLATLSIMPYFMGVPFIFPTTMARAMSFAVSSRGAAASCLATSRQFCAFIGSLTAALIPDNAMLPSVLFMVIIAILVTSCIYMARRHDPSLIREQAL